uniref:Uncharacterized protein n=1 Tax=Acrobeloides nanus TaxID=290746 RepID=A0A914BVU4_9BILA
MELRMASLEDEIRKLSNRVDLIIENRNIVELRNNTNHIEPIQEPIQEASMSVSIINDTFSIEDSSSTVCLLDVTSCNDNIEHKEILNLIPPSQPIIQNPPKAIKTTTTEKKRSRKDHTPIRNTMVVPTPLSFQEPEPACSIIPATLLLNVNNPIPQTLVEPKKNRRAEKNKKRQRSSEEEIPDEEIENLKNI